MIRSTKNQKGEIRFGLILGIIVMVAVIYFAVQMVPVMYHSYAFQKAVEDIALEAAGQRARSQSADKIKQRVLQEAENHDCKEDILRTAKERNIEPVRIDRTSSQLTIHVEYVKPVDLIVTEWKWRVDKTEIRTLY